MLTLGLTHRIWACVEPVDGHKSFGCLAGMVAAELGQDPLSGDLLVFKNRRGDRLKILAWQGDGFPCTCGGWRVARSPSRRPTRPR